MVITLPRKKIINPPIELGMKQLARSDCNKHRKDRCHYNANGTAKIGYNEPPRRKGYIAYQCPICGRWHLSKEHMKTTQLVSNGGELQPSICTAKKSDLVVLLDAGHWSGEKGKRSFDERFLEYEQNRIIQARVVEELKKLGIRYEIVTPEVDTYVSLTERCRRVNAYCDKYGTANCVCLSLHFNAFGSTWNEAKGYGVYTSPGKTASDAVAKIIDEEVDKIWVKQYHRVNRHMKEDPFTMVVKPKCRACLLEQGFYTNKQEMDWLLSEEGRYACTTIIVNAVKRLCSDFSGVRPEKAGAQ